MKIKKYVLLENNDEKVVYFLESEDFMYVTNYCYFVIMNFSLFSFYIFKE